MAANEINLTIKVSDDGNLKIVGKNAEKAADGLNKAGKSARTADRNLKGASQQSANGTKNFSKMAQGISGSLVPAYATLAANIFAITAAFGFLKESADFRVLQDAQIAFSSATGVGLRSLTSDIKEASDGLIGFKESAQAAAIGVAAGLNPKQIEGFAEGAKNASLILGRDVTDSFNRLIRGVTKAEPELLDELGIILRLDDATAKYAASIGKAAKDLSVFERSQAVAVEVQEQLDKKYASVAGAVQLQSNAVAQLGVEFEKVLLPFREFITSMAEPTAKFLADNIRALTAAFALFAIPLVKAIIPNLEAWGETSREAAMEAADAYEYAKLEIEELKIAQDKLNQSSPLKGAQEALQGVDVKSKGAKAIQAGDFENVSPKQVNALLAAAEKGKGAVVDMSNEMRTQYIASLKAMKDNTDTQMGFIERKFKKTTTFLSLQAKRVEAAWKGAMAKVKSAGELAAKGVDKAFKGMALIGIIVLIKDLAVQAGEALGVIGQSQEIQDLANSFKDLQKDLKNTSIEFSKFTEIQNAFFEKNAGKITLDQVAAVTGFASQAGSKLTEINEAFVEMERLRAKGLDLDAGTASQLLLGYENIEDAAKGLAAESVALTGQLIEGLEAGKLASQTFGGEFIGLVEKIRAKGGITGLTDDERERFAELSTHFSELQSKANILKEENQAISQEYDRQLASVTQFQTSTTQLVKRIEQQIEAEGEITSDNEARLATYQKQLAVLKKIHDAEIKFANDRNRLEFAKTKAMIGATELQRQERDRLLQIQGIEIDRAELQNQLDLATADGVERDQDKIDSLNIQLGILDAQEESLIRQGELAAQLADTLKQSFETAMTKGLADLIKGDETSIKDAIASLARSVLSSLADTLATNIVSSIMNAGQETPEQKIKTAMHEAADYHAMKIKEAMGSPTGTAEGSAKSSVLEEITVDAEKVSTEPPKKKKGLMEKLFGESKTTATRDDTHGAEGVTVTQKVGGSVNNFLGAFSDIFDKNAEGGFMEKLGIAFEAGGNIFSDLFGSLGDLFGGLFEGMGGAGGIMSFFGFAKGGIAKGGFRSMAYASGGVATRPTIGLVGEGKHNEAIVPLPDGKSIPVSMPGGGAGGIQQNNVTVNVAVDSDGNGSTEVESGQQGADLGRMVAAAVQRELINQKRAGGILNPMGVA